MAKKNVILSAAKDLAPAPAFEDFAGAGKGGDEDGGWSRSSTIERVIRCLECGITHAQGGLSAQVLHNDEEILAMTVHNPGCLVAAGELHPSMHVEVDHQVSDDLVNATYHISVIRG